MKSNCLFLLFKEYVWKRPNAKDLISSLILEYPTGTMLTWETNNPPELKGDHKYDERQGAVKLILDGQQRITTLYMLMTGEIPPYYKEHEILTDIRNLYVNVETLSLEYYKIKTMQNDPLWINLTEIFNGKVRSRDVVSDLEEKLGVKEFLEIEKISLMITSKPLRELKIGIFKSR